MDAHPNRASVRTGTGTDWNARLSQELNQRQFEFVTATDQAVLGLAGPGSGKTRALTYRAANLLAGGVDPGSILLVTFTNKASGEMKDRISRLLGSLPSRMWAGTFHAIGARMLRRYASRVGRTPDFTILDSDDSSQLTKAAFGTLDVTLDAPARRMLFGRGLMARIISAARNADTAVDSIMRDMYPDLGQYTDLAQRVEIAYEERKLRANAFDFDDLLCSWLKVMQDDPELAKMWQNRFQHVLVDEYQDTNVIQASLVEILAPGGAVAVVGDDAQSIYAFRQADLRNILRFSDTFPGCRVVRLEENYRSTPEILELANQVIRKNRQQLHKTLFTRRPPGEKPWLVQARDPQNEAQFVALEVARMAREGAPLNEIAVLYRSGYLSQSLEMELLSRNIPYVTVGGRRFLDRAHIRDVLAYLRLLVNPWDELSWGRVIMMQEGIGPATFARLWDQLSQSPDPLSSALSGNARPSRGVAGWRELVSALGDLSGLYGENRPIPVLFRTLMGGIYGRYLDASYDDARERRLAIDQLAAYSAGFEDLGGFLRAITLNESLMVGQDGLALSGAVTLSTCHSAKGKEWDTVFITSLVQSRFPDSRSLDNLEEERRLFYVAVTRARSRLFLSFCQYDRGYGGEISGAEPSEFIQELSQDSYLPHYVLNDGHAAAYQVD